MKKTILLLAVLAFSFSANAQDYKWTLAGGSAFEWAKNTDADFSVGTLSIGSYYSLTENLQLGVGLAMAFANYDGETESATALSLAGRYFFNQLYVGASYPLNEDAESSMGEGINLGLGYRLAIADRVDFVPSFAYNLDGKIPQLSMNFEIKL